MATNYTGNVTPSLSNAPASSWTDDAAKRSHVGNTYLVTGSGGTAGNVYAFEEYAAPLVKNASGLPADIVTITDGGEDLPMVKAEVSLSPIQSGSGDPSPTNVRPISGHTGATLKIGAEYPTADREYTSSFGQTVYGGTFDFVSGDGKSAYKIFDAAAIIANFESFSASNRRYIAYMTGSDASVIGSSGSTKNTANAVSNIMSCNYSWNEMQSFDGSETKCGVFRHSSWNYARVYISISDPSVTTRAEAEAWLTNNGFTLCYEIATPTAIDIDPTEVETLLGLNNVWSDGQISALTYQSNQFIPKYDWFETWNMPKITRNNGSVIVLPYPKEYTPEIHDVDAATTGRNAAGTMIRDRVAIKHKFNYVFPPLSQADATELLAATKDASFTLTTASPETGAKTNYRVYAGDKSLPVYWMPNHDTASWLYSSVSVNLIEM